MHQAVIVSICYGWNDDNALALILCYKGDVLSCHWQGSVDSCCSPKYGLVVLALQWVPGYGPADEFTIHGTYMSKARIHVCSHALICRLVARYMVRWEKKVTFYQDGMSHDANNADSSGGRPPSRGCDRTRSSNNVGNIIRNTNPGLHQKLRTYWPSYKGDDNW